MAENPMLKAAERLKTLRDTKDDLEKRLKEVNADIERANHELSDMICCCKPPFRRNSTV